MIADAREIQTKRLRLRPFREEDYDDLYEFLAQLKDDEFEGYPGITYENGRKHLLDRLDSTAYYAVELIDSGKVIGNVYCGDREYDAKEVGYIIHRLYRRKGYGAEALSAVIRRAFYEGAHRVYAMCDPRNVPSWKLLERVGMRREAHFRQNVFFHRGETGAPIWKDTFVYALLNGDQIQKKWLSESAESHFLLVSSYSTNRSTNWNVRQSTNPRLVSRSSGRHRQNEVCLSKDL